MRQLILVTSLLLLTACGQSGDLYLPPNDPATKPAEPAPPATGPAAEEKKDKK